MSVPEKLATWHDAMVAEQLSEKTVSVRISMVDVVTRASGLRDPRHLTRQHILQVFEEREHGAATRLKYLEHISLWARFEGVPDPTEGIKRPKGPRYRPRPLTPENYATVMSHLKATAPLPYRWARVGGELGFRSFEVAKIQGRDLDPSSRTLHVIGKAGRETDVDVPDDLFEDLWSLAQESPGPLWPRTTNQMVSTTVAIYAAQVGVRLKFHQFRHTAITRYYQKTRDLVATQDFARHESPETTAIYALADRKNHRRTLNSLHNDETVSDADSQLLAVLHKFGMTADDLFRMLLDQRQTDRDF
ncbi:tyrosine-type recombinase/integrase [Streptomyces sp. NPDC057302]|uniref:tyrosine-type recombinase/integrase n=1 Tax=Streptomyces sp. NPDC057302 TaxID=3346094 RepID=UPI00363F8F58